MTFDLWPTGRKKNDDCHASASEVLLVLEVLVRCDEYLEPRILCRSDEFPILKLRPSLLVRGCHFMVYQRLAQWRRSPLIEQNFHSGRFEGAAGSMFKDGFRLVGQYTGKPLDELVKRRVVF